MPTAEGEGSHAEWEQTGRDRRDGPGARCGPGDALASDGRRRGVLPGLNPRFSKLNIEVLYGLDRFELNNRKLDDDGLAASSSA